MPQTRTSNARGARSLRSAFVEPLPRGRHAAAGRGAGGCALAGQAHARPAGGRAADRGRADLDGQRHRGRSRDRRRLHGHAAPRVLRRDAEELRDAVDQPRPDGVRAAQRLRRDRHRHGARRRRLRPRAVRRHPVRRAQRLRRARLLGLEQRPLRGARVAGRQPQGRPGADDAVVGQRPAGRGDGRRHDDARRGAGVLHRRHQPRDVPLHADEPPLHGPRAGAGHDAPAGPHPAGREPQPGRRQPHLPQQLHRLPLRAWTR